MIKRACLAIIIVLLSARVLPAAAADASGTVTNSTPNPVSPPPDASAKAQSPGAGEQKEDNSAVCDKDLPEARLGPSSKVIVALDPDTLWRPRDAEVRFTFKSGQGSQPQISQVWVCFRWSNPAPKLTLDAIHTYLVSPLVRSVSTTTGIPEYGAIVPALPELPEGVVGRWKATSVVSSTGIYTVPLADMQIVAELADQAHTKVAVVLPVGITSVNAAIVGVIIAMSIAFGILFALAPHPAAFGDADWVIRVISTRKGIASLSQFQIMLWTLVIGAASIYVMVLSGNLIVISAGTLTLLGIAGGVSVVDPLTKSSVTAKNTIAESIIKPHWGQLLSSDPSIENSEIDVNHVQMLVFTLITAIFVGIKVAVSYEIPTIPDNFLLLMGISNGVYIAGRQLNP